jgi:hypothetical protein
VTALGVSRALAALTAAVLVVAVTASSAGASNQPAAPLETLGPLGVGGSNLWSKAYRSQKAPADSSGGFVYRKGRYTSIRTIPGAAPLSDVRGFPGATVLQTHFAINDRGETAGIYADAVPGDDGLAPPGSAHGFVKNRRGDLTTFDVPGAAQILVKGNNNRGQVVGEYVDPGAMPGPDGLLPPDSVSPVRVFVLDKERFTSFDPPGTRGNEAVDVRCSAHSRRRCRITATSRCDSSRRRPSAPVSTAAASARRRCCRWRRSNGCAHRRA